MTRSHLLLLIQPSAFVLSAALASTVVISDVPRQLMHRNPSVPVPSRAAAEVVKSVPAQAPASIQQSKPRELAAAKSGLSQPLAKLRVTSKFGPRIHPITKRRSFHNGTDFAAKLNDRVFSVEDGVVVRAGSRGALGNAVEVVNSRSNLRTIFGHLNKVAVKSGQRVEAGDVVGFAGTTGRSTGVHLHLITKTAKSGKVINPATVLAATLNTAPTADVSTNLTSVFAVPSAPKPSLASAVTQTSITKSTVPRTMSGVAISNEEASEPTFEEKVSAKIREAEVALLAAKKASAEMTALYQEGIVSKKKLEQSTIAVQQQEAVLSKHLRKS